MDDVTIEDEVDGNEDVSSESVNVINLTKWSYIFQLLSQQWITILVLSISILVFIYLRRNRRENVKLSTDDSVNRYEQMERIRQKQQKEYEEQALRRAQEKKDKLESLKSSTNESSSRMKYRSNDHNPLTGQPTKGSNDSCSWRPSSSRRKPAGG